LPNPLEPNPPSSSLAWLPYLSSTKVSGGGRVEDACDWPLLVGLFLTIMRVLSVFSRKSKIKKRRLFFQIETGFSPQFALKVSAASGLFHDLPLFTMSLVRSTLPNSPRVSSSTPPFSNSPSERRSSFFLRLRCF